MGLTCASGNTGLIPTEGGSSSPSWENNAQPPCPIKTPTKRLMHASFRDGKLTDRCQFYLHIAREVF